MSSGGSLRDWLRRVMPWVAAAAGVLFVLDYLLVPEEIEDSGLPLPLVAAGLVLSLVAFLAVAATVIYYGYKAGRWTWRRALWRLRRRLVITYLFVGLTPILLLGLIGLVMMWGTTSEAMSRAVTAQLETTIRQVDGAARSLAAEYSRLPPASGDPAVRVWLSQRVAALRDLLPNARVSVWRGPADAAPALTMPETVAEEAIRPPGVSGAYWSGPLPRWLRVKERWSGLAYQAPPEEARILFGSSAICAVAREAAPAPNEGPFTFLVEAPLDRALVRDLKEVTGLKLHPYFLAGEDVLFKKSEKGLEVSLDKKRVEQEVQSKLKQDQFGDPVSQWSYLVVMEATDWDTGSTSSRLVFLFDWSLAEMGRQILVAGSLGQAWKVALIGLGCLFLVFELMALIVAVFMTREVTGTVHELDRATQVIRRGDFSHRVRPVSRDQLGELADQFNDMAARIESLLHERLERERLEQEIQIAAQVQSQLFPTCVPRLATAEISGECRAARGVAGDYYDYLEIAPGLVALVVGDVSGKGISASLVMSNLQASVRAQTTLMSEAPHKETRLIVAGGPSSANARVPGSASSAEAAEGVLGRLTGRINAQLCRSTQANRFATLFLAVYDDDSRLLSYTNAGHNAPILVRGNGSVERLSVGGMIVGVIETASYRDGRAGLDSGSLLVVFSDGISEAESPAGEQYGEERLVSFAVAHRHMGAHQIREALFAEVDHWSRGQERGDDQTLVVVKSAVDPARL